MNTVDIEAMMAIKFVRLLRINFTSNYQEHHIYTTSGILAIITL